MNVISLVEKSWGEKDFVVREDKGGILSSFGDSNR